MVLSLNASVGKLVQTNFQFSMVEEKGDLSG